MWNFSAFTKIKEWDKKMAKKIQDKFIKIPRI